MTPWRQPKYFMTELPHLDEINEENWEALESAFARAAVWPMHILVPHPRDYGAGEVRLGWHENALVIFADLPDVDIRTDARENHEAMWLLGDVFEIFVKREAFDPYFELHVTPNNHCLQLRFPDAQALGALSETKGSWRDFIVTDPVFSYRARVDAAAKKWQVFARVPWKSLAGDSPVKPESWKLSCCRYDYRSDLEKPVLCSTSLHEVLNYHRQSDWQLVGVG